MTNPPAYDIVGLHILDPNDTYGRKSAYITLLQEKALQRYVPKGNGCIAVDLGCGFGRLTPLLMKQGWQAVGVDPSADLLQYAEKNYSGPEYRCGGLPDLPLAEQSISLLLIQNVLRPLKMMNKLYCARGFGKYLMPNSRVLVVDNLWMNHPDFLSEQTILDIMETEGLKLVEKVPLRAARWWMIYLIRYGLIPRSWFDVIAEWELNHMSRRKGMPRWQYWNVLFVFQKTR